MRVAYLLLAHKNFWQVKSLIDLLNCDDNFFVLHIDGNSDDLLKELERCQLKKVYFTEKRLHIQWGGYNIVQATLELIKEALKHGFDYGVLLSGQHMLIKSNRAFIDFLRNRCDTEYIQAVKLPKKEWVFNGGLDRIKYFWLMDELGFADSFRLVKSQQIIGLRRNFLKDFIPYGGSQWWMLTRSCLEYIVDFIEQNPEHLEYYRYCFVPDEIIFQTIIMNSCFRDKVENNNYVYLNWGEGFAHPKILKMEDIEQVQNSNKYFARKFDENIDQGVIEFFLKNCTPN